AHDFEDSLDCVARFLAELCEFLVAQQLMRLDYSELLHRRGPPEIVERARNLPVAAVDQSIKLQVTLVVRLRRLRGDPNDVFKHGFAKTFERKSVKFPEQLPVGLFDATIHDGPACGGR